jgi:raffinose/stachyose/melibiose transport system substrate-binding protein
MRGIKLLLILSIIIVTLAGCTNQNPVTILEPDVTSEEDKIVLKFINSWGGSDPKAETLTYVFNTFSAVNNDIEISNESLFGDDFLVKLKTDFATGNDPDVFGLWPGSDIKTLIKVGKVAELTDVLKSDPAWMNSFDPKMWQHTTVGEKIYGLPVEQIFEALYVNVDLFERYNVKIPTNYPELKEAVVAFRSNDVIPIAFNCKAEGSYLYQNMAMMIGGKSAIEEPISENQINPCFITAMEYMKELYELDAFPEDMYTMTSVERNNLFIEKKAAMLVQGSWFISAVEERDDVDIVPFPEMVEDGDNYSSMIYGLGCGTFYMSQKAWEDPVRREASIRLLRHLTSKETATIFAEKTGMFSCVDIYDTQIKYGKLAIKGISLTNSAKFLVGPPDSYLERTKWEDFIVKYFPYVLQSEITPEELWSQALE